MGFIDRDIVISFVVGIALGVGGTLLLSGDDSSDSSSRGAKSETPSAPTETGDTGSAPADGAALAGVGEPAISGGITITVNDARTEPRVTYVGNTCSQITPDCKETTKSAPQGGRYIFVETTVTNNTSQGVDLTCSFPIDAKLVDDSGRKFDPIEGLDQLQGNPECNSLLQSGFRDQMAWVFLVPPDAEVSEFEFSDVTNFNNAGPAVRVSLPPV